MTLRTRIAGAGTACIVAGALGLLPAASAHAASTSAAKTVATAAAKATPAATSVPVTGTTSAGSLVGSLSNLSTSVVNGVLTLTGTLTGTVTSGDRRRHADPGNALHGARPQRGDHGGLQHSHPQPGRHPP